MEDSLRDKSRLMKAVTVFVWLLTLVAIATFFFLIKANGAVGGETRRTITVTGKTERYVPPDIAKLTFTISEEGKTASEAQEKSSKKSNDVIAALEKFDIAKKDIKSIGYNIYPKYEYKYQSDVQTTVPCYGGYCPPPYYQKEEIVGYKAEQSMVVTIRDVNEAGDVVAAVGKLNVSNISGLSFEVEKYEDVVEEVKNEAIGDARAKAKERAKTLGVRLGKLLSVSDSGNYPYPVPYMMEKSITIDGRGGGGDFVAPEIAPGENQIVSSVTLVYEIK